MNIKVNTYYNLFRKIEIFRAAFDAAVIDTETTIDQNLTKEEVVQILMSLHSFNQLNSKLLDIMERLLNQDVYQYCEEYGITYNIIK